MSILTKQSVIALYLLAIFSYVCINSKLQFKIKSKISDFNETCGRFPTEQHITIDNVIWQVAEHPRGLVKILNAYLDLRQQKSVVRINVNSIALNNSDIFHCQFWDENGNQLSVVRSTEILQMKRKQTKVQRKVKLNDL
jgi:hypothetical protein